MVEDTLEFPTTGGMATASARLYSPTGGAGLGVVVIPDEASPSSHVGDVCTRLVDEGFTALALDATAPQRRPTAAETAAALAGAVDVLCAHDAVRGTGVGVVGFAGGAAPALWLASLRPDEIGAVVPFYELPAPEDEPDWTRISASLEGHFAEVGETPERVTVEGLETRLSELGKEARVFTYPGTEPGFFDDTRTGVYDAEAAWQAWVRTLEFLRAKLG